MMNGRRISLVERYLNGRMTATEARDFQLRLESDPKLRQLLRDEQEIEQALRRDSESIPKLGSQRLEQFVKASAGKGPPGSGSSVSLKAAGTLQRGVKEILLQLITGRGFLVMAAVGGTVIVSAILMQKDDPAAVPLPAAADTVQTASVHDTSQPSPAVASEHFGLSETQAIEPAASGALSDKGRQISGPLLTPLPEKQVMERIQLSSLPAADTILAPPLKNVVSTTIARPNEHQVRKPKSNSPTDDSLDAMRQRMEQEGGRQQLLVEPNDSVRTKVFNKD